MVAANMPFSRKNAASMEIPIEANTQMPANPDMSIEKSKALISAPNVQKTAHAIRKAFPAISIAILTGVFSFCGRFFIVLHSALWDPNETPM